MRRPWLRPFVLAINHLGNGWMYPREVLLLAWSVPERALAAGLAAAVAAGTAYLVYRPLLGMRPAGRPDEADPEMQPSLGPLDRYSFPSGHGTSVTAVPSPIVVSAPSWRTPALVCCALIG